MWAAITVGRASRLDIWQHGLASRFEFVYRISVVCANLEEGPSGSLIKTDAYTRLDPSEKGAISYFLGLDFVKLFAEIHLHTPWLMHVDVYHNAFDVECPSKSRPDLFGRNTSGEWIIAESKGRTKRFDRATLQKAKEQSTKLTTIANERPVLRFGAVTYFNEDRTGLGQDRLALCVSDPPANQNNEKIVNFPLRRTDFFKYYYRLVRSFLSGQSDTQVELHQNDKFVVSTLPEVDLRIGLRTDLIGSETPESIEEVDSADLFERRPETPMTPAEFRTLTQHGVLYNSPIYIGHDGILVELGPSWKKLSDRLLSP